VLLLLLLLLFMLLVLLVLLLLPLLQNVLSGLQHDRQHRWQPVSHMIAICMARQPNPDKLMPLWEELAAVACAVQNMHLMSTSLGVAAYWSSWHDTARDSPQMLKFLGLDYAKGDRCAVPPGGGGCKTCCHNM
jgi:hypothetical protein